MHQFNEFQLDFFSAVPAMFPGWPPMGVPPMPPGQQPPATSQEPAPGAAATAGASSLPQQGTDFKISSPFHSVPSFTLHDYIHLLILH